MSSGWVIAMVAALTSSDGVAPPIPNTREIQGIINKLVEDKAVLGLVLGVTVNGQDWITTAGKASHDDKFRALDGDSLFEIGSVTKTYTSLLFANMVERGEVKIDDPVETLLPKGVRCPERGGLKIRLEHLATHHSGLPRLPDGMFWSLFSDDPYKDYNEEKLFKYLPRTRPAAKAGERYDYSNFGAGLLGCVLARKLGMNYEAALRQRVLAPLGLADTKIVLSDSDKARLALGHDESQKPTSNWHFTDALAGAGALRSTVRDQLKYLKANLDPSSITDVHLRNAVTNTHRQRHSVGKNMGVALGWHLSRKKPDSQPIIWHNGGTGGYHSFVGFVAGKKAGVVLLANTSSGHVDVAANEVLEILIRESTP